MSRKVAGLYLLVCTLIGALALNVATHQAVPGSAAMLPAPPPPAVGSCVTPSSTGWHVVDCNQPHTAEIAEAWAGSSLPSTNLYQNCVDATSTYLDVQPTNDVDSAWSSPAVLTRNTLIHGPGTSLAPRWSWQACLVSPTVPDLDTAGYRGRLRDTLATGRAPVDLRSCFDRPVGVGLVGVSCKRDHVGEILAARMLRVSGDYSDPQPVTTDPSVTRQCADLARRSTGAADPTYGRRLSVVVHLFPTGFGFSVSGNKADDAAASYVLYRASCTLEASAGHQLYGSVFGVGNGPIPLR